mgnify:CR=1 FL=1
MNSVYTSDDGHEVDVPIILLVNGESASASEVLTGALKDNDWATIVARRPSEKESLRVSSICRTAAD